MKKNNERIYFRNLQLYSSLLCENSQTKARNTTPELLSKIIRREPTPTKASSQKQTQKENPAQASHTVVKTKNTAAGSKEAAIHNTSLHYDSDDDPSSEGSDAGRNADRSGPDNEPDK